MTDGDSSAAGGVHGSPPSRQNLVSWWRQFSKKVPKPNDKDDLPKEKPGIFGVPLRESIQYANVAISLTDANGNSFIYGYVPIVVAKCGVFLKEKATDVEGIFRLSGSAKRIKDLQTIFNSPDKYGKGLDWTGYTVHDAANVLRRYLNQLPEPIIPLEFYDRFRAPLSMSPQDAIKVYQRLITELPPLNRQLLLYILDLLAVFASKSDQNLMTSQNLSAIFQPGLISHPNHDMSPEDYRISQDVLVFLIENQDHFLLGMKGPTDEIPATIPNTPTILPRRSVTVVSRSPSSASAAAEDVRKNGGIRRNVSVSSKKSAASSPKIGVSRSNTLPSKRSPNSRPTSRPNSFKPSDPSPPILGSTTPTATTPVNTIPTPLAANVGRSPSGAGHMTENVSPDIPTVVRDRQYAATKAEPLPVISKEQLQRLRDEQRLSLPTGPFAIEATPSPSPGPMTPSKERNLASFFLSPGSDSEKTKPNKLRKKRIPGSNNHSAESSTTSLPSHSPSIGSNAAGFSHTPVPQQVLETVPQSPSASVLPAEDKNSHIDFVPQLPPSASNQNLPQASTSIAGFHALSPTRSAGSSLSSHSEQEMSSEQPENNKRRSRWRFPGKMQTPPMSPTFGPSKSNGSAHGLSSLTSPKRERSEGRGKRDPSSGGEGSGEDGKGAKGALGWLQKKMSERNDRRRDNQSPQQTSPQQPQPQSQSQTQLPTQPPPQKIQKQNSMPPQMPHNVSQQKLAATPAGPQHGSSSSGGGPTSTSTSTSAAAAAAEADHPPAQSTPAPVSTAGSFSHRRRFRAASLSPGPAPFSFAVSASTTAAAGSSSAAAGASAQPQRRRVSWGRSRRE